MPWFLSPSLYSKMLLTPSLAPLRRNFHPLLWSNPPRSRPSAPNPPPMSAIPTPASRKVHPIQNILRRHRCTVARVRSRGSKQTPNPPLFNFRATYTTSHRQFWRYQHIHVDKNDNASWNALFKATSQADKDVGDRPLICLNMSNIPLFLR